MGQKNKQLNYSSIGEISNQDVIQQELNWFL